MLFNSWTVQRRSKKTVWDTVNKVEGGKEVVKKSDWQWHQCCLHLLCLTSFWHFWQFLCVTILSKSLQRITYPATILTRSCVLPNVSLENCWHSAGTAFLAILKIHNPPPSPSLSSTHCEVLLCLPSSHIWTTRSLRTNCPRCNVAVVSNACRRRRNVFERLHCPSRWNNNIPTPLVLRKSPLPENKNTNEREHKRTRSRQQKNENTRKREHKKTRTQENENTRENRERVRIQCKPKVTMPCFPVLLSWYTSKWINAEQSAVATSTSTLTVPNHPLHYVCCGQ